MFEKLDEFIEEESDEMLVTGGWGDDKIQELEKEINLQFREELKEFIRKYCLLMGYGVEIRACGRTGKSPMVEDTLGLREDGLENKYIVIMNNGEIIYCMDNETGKIVNWGLDNGEAYPEANDLETFIMDQLEDARDNW